jgi:hypothetical protein
MYHRKMEKQTRSAKSVKTLTPPEPSDDSEKSPPLPQVQAFNRLTPDRSMLMPRNRNSWHQRPHN